MRSLSKPQAETVARHLVAAGRLVDDDPAAALAHALAARRRASRVGAVREAVGLAAYRAGEWQTALAELRTYQRITGRQAHLPVVADCERALGRPERAIDIHRSAGHELAPAEALELLIVAAGARRDLGQLEAALAMLQVPELNATEATAGVARLWYAYADALQEAGRGEEAREWFARAAVADEDAATDAAERLLELDGVVIDETTDETMDQAMDGASDEAEGKPAHEATDDEATDDAPAATAVAGTATTMDPGQAGLHESPAGEAPAASGTADLRTADLRTADLRTADLPDVRRLVDAYDLVILDLDGVVYLGEEPVPGAAEAIARLRKEGPRVVYATNNASRRADQVAALLNRVGVEASADEVLTSAAAAADVLAERLAPGDAVLVVGADGLAAEVERVGLRPVRSAGEAPAAVVQGYGPEVGWSDLAEAHLAIQAGARWVVTNPDLTLPHPRGILPGNGAMVAALRASLGREPDLVIGKPQPALFTAAVRRAGARTPLVVGDRLDTDIEGANRAGMDSLLVLTGCTDPAGAVAATGELRPTYVGADLAALFAPGNPPATAASAA